MDFSTVVSIVVLLVLAAVVFYGFKSMKAINALAALVCSLSDSVEAFVSQNNVELQKPEGAPAGGEGKSGEVIDVKKTFILPVLKAMGCNPQYRDGMLYMDYQGLHLLVAGPENKAAQRFCLPYILDIVTNSPMMLTITQLCMKTQDNWGPKFQWDTVDTMKDKQILNVIFDVLLPYKEPNGEDYVRAILDAFVNIVNEFRMELDRAGKDLGIDPSSSDFPNYNFN